MPEYTQSVLKHDIMLFFNSFLIKEFWAPANCTGINVGMSDLIWKEAVREI